MGAVSIPMLPAAIALTGNEQLEIVQAGVSMRATAKQVQGVGLPSNPQTTNYTAQLTDNSLSVDMNGQNLTATIPANSAVAFAIGAVLTFTNLNATPLTVAINGPDTLTLSPGTNQNPRAVAQNGMLFARKVGTQAWLCWGAGVS